MDNKDFFKNKTALVTGASGGIGRAIALALDKEGVRVGIHYNSHEDSARELLNMMTTPGAMIFKCNLTDENEVAKMFSEIRTTFGRLDILINNAGIVNNGMLLRMKTSKWKDVLDTDLSSAFYCSRDALPIMLKNNWGRIINISSVSALHGNYGQSNYAAAKGALISFSKSLAREVGNHNITVNTIAPGLIDTEMLTTVPEEHISASVEKQAIKRLGTPEDVAGLAVFLAGPSAGFITAQCICIDGGLL
jgi:3-oxoacyl-[acyl-carrier protein] reductase